MLRVRVEIVPWGQESLAEEIARLHVGNVGGTKYTGHYQVRLVDPEKEWRMGDPLGEVIGTFKCHRYGWYRNRLGLAARALKMLQLRRDRGKALPIKPPFQQAAAYTREKA